MEILPPEPPSEGEAVPPSSARKGLGQGSRELQDTRGPPGLHRAPSLSAAMQQTLSRLFCSEGAIGALENNFILSIRAHCLIFAVKKQDLRCKASSNPCLYNLVNKNKTILLL